MRRLIGVLVSAAALLVWVPTIHAQDQLVPAGTLLQCTLDEPNFSSATAAVGDPVLCHLRTMQQFGRPLFPRGSMLGGHLEADQEPGHFVGKGYLKVTFDRVILPSGDLPVPAKVILARGYKVDKQGAIDGKGHATRDVVEWMIPPLWPWKVIMLPARGPRPALKGESTLSLRLMDDVQIPQVAQTYGPNWHFFGHVQNNSFDAQVSAGTPQLAVRQVDPVGISDQAPQVTQVSYAASVSRSVPMPHLANVASLPGMPVFVLTTGTVLSVSGYGYQDNRITYTLIGGGTGVISADEVDWNTTTQLNAQRGLRVTLHHSHANAGSAGF